MELESKDPQTQGPSLAHCTGLNKPNWKSIVKQRTSPSAGPLLQNYADIYVAVYRVTLMNLLRLFQNKPATFKMQPILTIISLYHIHIAFGNVKTEMYHKTSLMKLTCWVDIPADITLCSGYLVSYQNCQQLNQNDSCYSNEQLRCDLTEIYQVKITWELDETNHFQ